MAPSVSISEIRTHQCRNRPHLVPTAMTSPVTSEANANGTMAHEITTPIATHAARSI